MVQNLQNVAAAIDLHIYLAYSAAGSLGYGWYRQYKKHMNEREEKDKRIAKLEKQLDPGRTSSGLDVTGNSRSNPDERTER